MNGPQRRTCAKGRGAGERADERRDERSRPKPGQQGVELNREQRPQPREPVRRCTFEKNAVRVHEQAGMCNGAVPQPSGHRDRDDDPRLGCGPTREEKMAGCRDQRIGDAPRRVMRCGSHHAYQPSCLGRREIDAHASGAGLFRARRRLIRRASHDRSRRIGNGMLAVPPCRRCISGKVAGRTFMADGSHYRRRADSPPDDCLAASDRRHSALIHLSTPHTTLRCARMHLRREDLDAVKGRGCPAMHASACAQSP